MVENISKSNAIDPLSVIFEIQKATFQMQAIWISLLLGNSSYSGFIGEYKKVLEDCQSRGVQRNKRSYDQVDFAPTLYLAPSMQSLNRIQRKRGDLIYVYFLGGQCKSC